MKTVTCRLLLMSDFNGQISHSSSCFTKNIQNYVAQRSNEYILGHLKPQ